MSTYADAISTLLDTMGGSRSRLRIEHYIDEKNPNRLGYRIAGPTRDVVQDAITGLCDKVSDGSGYAVFAGPRRFGNEWEGLGQVVLYDVRGAS